MVSSLLSARSISTMRAEFLRAHAGHRLVEQQHARPGGERHREFELTMLAVAQRRDRLIGARAEADAGKRRARRLAQLRVGTGVAPETERVPGMRLHGERHVVEHAEIEKQRRDLERAREAEHGCAGASAAR